jgi:hypothetical protein
MWHNAVIPLMKTIPPLDKFLSRAPRAPTIDETSIKARLRAYADKQKTERTA